MVQFSTSVDIGLGEDPCEDETLSWLLILVCYWGTLLIVIPLALLYWHRGPRLKDNERVAGMLRTLGTWRASSSSRSGTAVSFEGSARNGGPSTISESRDLVIAGTVIMTLGGCWGFAIG